MKKAAPKSHDLSTILVVGIPFGSRKGDRIKLKLELVAGPAGKWVVRHDETRALFPDDVKRQEERRRILSKPKLSPADKRRLRSLEKEPEMARYDEWTAGSRLEARALTLIQRAAARVEKRKAADPVKLAESFEAVSASYTKPGVAEWFGRPREQLGGRTPAQAILDGDLDAVHALAKSLDGAGGAS